MQNSCVLYRYRQADRTCQVASAKSTASEAVQAGMGAAASAHFQPSRYSRLVEVPSYAQMHCSTSPVKHCVADVPCRLHILQARFVCLAVCRTSCSCKLSSRPTRLHTHTTHLTYWTQQPCMKPVFTYKCYAHIKYTSGSAYIFAVGSSIACWHCTYRFPNLLCNCVWYTDLTLINLFRIPRHASYMGMTSVSKLLLSDDYRMVQLMRKACCKCVLMTRWRLPRLSKPL